MNKSRLIIAIAILLGLTAAAVVTTRSRKAASGIEAPSASLPVVKKEELTRLEIARPGQPAIVLTKQADKWKVTAPLEAEAAQSSVESAVDKLAELKVTGVAASRKENYAKLEVDAEHAIRVKANAGDKPVLDLLIGASKSGGTMVRVEGQEPVLAVRGSIRYAFDRELKDFRKREITELSADQVTGLELSSAKGNFKFVRQGEAWAQAAGEKPIAKFAPENVHSLAGTLSTLRAADFANVGESDEATGLATPVAKAVLTLKEGAPISVTLGKEHASGEHYLRVSNSAVTYRVAKFTADRLQADAKSFEKSEPKAEPAPQGMPPGMPMAGGGGGLTPEMMQQLQRQMAAQGASPH